MNDYVKSSPHFFRLIKIAFVLLLLLLLGLALVVPAPLQGPADIGQVPNPSKSAWFLMWTQELVSYSNAMVWLIVALGLLFLLLPWLPLSPPADKARWWGKEQRWVNWLVLISFIAIVTLTIIAMYFRGENWAFVLG